MTELVWKSFKEEIPKNDYVFVAINDTIRIRHANELSPTGPYRCWAAIEYPPVPMKDCHDCSRNGFSCYECGDGTLLLVYDPISIEVSFCPFCGYNAKNK